MLERFGRYQLLRRLGRGGMGEVFLARVEGLPRRAHVVVKRSLPHLADDLALTRQFLDEAKAAAHVHHPNVAAMHELGVLDGRFYLVMEYVTGSDVATLAAGGPLPHALVARLIADAARGRTDRSRCGPHAGRALEVAHGDVTPKNLLVGLDGVTKVIDFGLTRWRGTRAEGSLGGTYAYLAPEQALDDVVDAKTDQFALGVVAWELLMGHALFSAEADVTTLDRVVACDVPALREVLPGLPPALEATVSGMLAKAPTARHATCAVVASRLEHWIDTERLGAQLRQDLAARVSTRTPLEVTDARLEALMEPLPLPSTRPLTHSEARAVDQLQTLPTPLTLATMEAALGDAALDLLQGLLEAGALQRLDDERFELTPTP
jgi:eukaryotic-like serine/threonine-protein kinase